ncbi:MAG TPA: hypothetical protein VKP66_14665 [Steroidobacteraceae bacterium]|nr:hypothetical protein [Steroidobacteraceae bacterium]
MQHSSTEANMRAQEEAPACCRTRSFGVCDRILVGLAILSIVRACDALAGERVPASADAAKPDFNVARDFAPTSAFTPSASTASASTAFASTPPLFYQSVPSSYQAIGLTDFKSSSATEFRPRGRSMLEGEPRPGGAQDPPMLRTTTVWQRLSDYRSRDRLRVVTLWETGGSSLSLQAGRKGDPSLQWTSRVMNRGGATRGVLDQLFATSLGGVARGLHLAPRTAVADTFGKPSKFSDTVPGNAGAATK